MDSTRGNPISQVYISQWCMELWNCNVGSNVIWRKTLLGHVKSGCKFYFSSKFVTILNRALRHYLFSFCQQLICKCSFFPSARHNTALCLYTVKSYWLNQVRKSLLNEAILCMNVKETKITKLKKDIKSLWRATECKVVNIWQDSVSKISWTVKICANKSLGLGKRNIYIPLGTP